MGFVCCWRKARSFNIDCCCPESCPCGKCLAAPVIKDVQTLCRGESSGSAARFFSTIIKACLMPCAACASAPRLGVGAAAAVGVIMPGGATAAGMAAYRLLLRLLLRDLRLDMMAPV